MVIDRQQAATWSKDRVKEEISDLRRYIAEIYSETSQLQEKADSLSAAIESGAHPFSRSSDPYKHTDGMYDAIAREREIIPEYEADVEFLKSLL